LVVLEAFNQGVPIVSTDVGCVGEMVGDELVAKKQDDLFLILLNVLYSKRNASASFQKDYCHTFVDAYMALYKGVKQSAEGSIS